MQHISNHIEPMKTLALRIARNRLTQLERDLIDTNIVDFAFNSEMTLKQLKKARMRAYKSLNHHLKTLYSLT